MRLNQYISHNTKYSRREADLLIEEGRVKIGQKKAELGDSIDARNRETKIFIDSKIIKPRNQNIYTAIVYNKPKGEIVSKKDSMGRKIIFDALGKKFSHFVSAGRLDFASEGVLILSDSKLVVDKLMRSNMPREYIIKASGDTKKDIIESMCSAMENGLSLKDARAGGHVKNKIVSMDFAPFIKYEITKLDPKHMRIKVVITEGKNRELRRFFAHFGFDISDLKRVKYGFVELNNLPSGKWRYLNKDEYKSLHEFMTQ